MTIHLSILVFAPLAFAFAGTLLPGRLAGYLGLAGSLVALGLSVAMLLDFNQSADGLQYVTDDKWISALGIRWSLGVDGLNLWLIGLTTLVFAASSLWIVLRPVERPGQFAFLMGLAETAVLGAFTAQDLLLFVLFFDLMLVPFLFLMFGWGGPERRSATIKMIIYTLVGSLLMLAAAVATGVLAAQQTDGGLTFALSDLSKVSLGAGTQRLLFAAFALAFLIKMPAFLVHGWMPDAYRQMPLPALAAFSAVLSKVAAYGFLRVALPLFPDAAVDFQTILMILSVVGIIYGSAMAFTATNLRLILGYSSLAQLSFITLGIFSLTDQGVQGALIQAVNHGLVVAPLFFVVLLAAERAGGAEDVRELGGLAFAGPVLASLTLVLALATLAIPGSANFVGEFFILFGAFKAKLVLSVIAFTGVAMASVYMLRAYIRTFHNRVGPAVVAGRDMTLRDGLILVPLVIVIVAFALYPQAALRDGEQAVRGKTPLLAKIDATRGAPRAVASTKAAP
ncbi:MAG: NADH-quinone oxidoreductase subunit [Solirubrobacteraceae bacterium]|nr:NADH-quinone oxidoreductase subunit [Solirubrobacteraceae bacterium]